MKFIIMVLSSLLLVTIMAACGGNQEIGEQQAGQPETKLDEQQDEKSETALDEGYKDAISVVSQLALGTIQLEETEVTLTEEQATALIPLWQAYQSLSTSDSAAAIELTSVVKQIQRKMTDEQIDSIAGMQLTTEDVTAFIEEQGAQFGRGAFGGMGSGDDEEGNSDRMPGAMEGGMPPGGGMPGGGGSGRNMTGMDPAAMETRTPEMGSSPEEMAERMQNRMLFSAVIRTLQNKAGVVDETAPLNPSDRMSQMAMNIASQTTGISVEELKSQTDGGGSLADAITALGGDVEMVKDSFTESLANIPLAEGQELDQLVEDLLYDSTSIE